MKRFVVALLLTGSALFAQAPTATNDETGSVAGTVTDAGNGEPLRDVDVSFNQNSRTPKSTKTDSQGHYELRGLPAGNIRISASQRPAGGRGFGNSQTRLVTLAAGEALSSVDFHAVVQGSISGRVLDENKEPMPGITVLLIAREYNAGVLRYVYADAGRTNDIGEYSLQRMSAGRGYLVLAERRDLRLPAISDAPSDPQLRRRVAAPVYYPGSPSREGAAPLTIRSGEHRESIDIYMKRVTGYCIDGVLESNGRPGPLTFSIAEAQPTSGASGNGAMYIGNPGGIAGDDGKIRICGLPPGEYTLTATGAAKERFSPPLSFSNTPVFIGDRDLHNMKFVSQQLFTLTGETVFEGAPPASPIEAKLSINLMPITRSFMGEKTNANSTMPGTFSMEGLPMDEYTTRINAVPPNLYVRDVTFNGHSILYDPLRLGSAMGDAGMRIVIGSDGGTISATVVDKDGKPVGDSRVLVMPVSISSEAMLAAAVLEGQTDQKGMWKSKMMEPARYYVLATTGPIDKSPETIGKLWQKRTKAQEIELNPKGSVSVNLTPLSLD